MLPATDQGCEAQHMAQGDAAITPGMQQGGSGAVDAALLLVAIRLQQPDHTGNRQEVGEGIEAEGCGGSRQGHQPPPQRGAHQLAHVEDHGEARQVGSQLGGLIHQQGAVLVSGGEFVGAGDPHQQGAGQQHHHLGGAIEQGNGEGPEQAGSEQGPLGLNQHGFAANPIGAHTGRTAHQQGGQGEGGEVEGQQHGIGRAIHEDPSLGGEAGERTGGAQARREQKDVALLWMPAPRAAHRLVRAAATIAAAPTRWPLRS